MTGNEETTVPRIDEGKWLGADEQHREWCVAIYGDGDFSDEGVTLGRSFPHRIHAEADRERMLGDYSDEDEHWQAEERSEVVWRRVGPWQAGDPPVGEATNPFIDKASMKAWLDRQPPGADWGSAWAELLGYIQEAADDGNLVRPEDLLVYMVELKARALAPVKEWMRKVGDGTGERA